MGPANASICSALQSFQNVLLCQVLTKGWMYRLAPGICARSLRRGTGCMRLQMQDMTASASLSVIRMHSGPWNESITEGQTFATNHGFSRRLSCIKGHYLRFAPVIGFWWRMLKGCSNTDSGNDNRCTLQRHILADDAACGFVQSLTFSSGTLGLWGSRLQLSLELVWCCSETGQSLLQQATAQIGRCKLTAAKI